MLGVLKRIGVPKKASFEAVDQFVAQNRDQPCTAYEIYLAMSEVIFMAQCEGAFRLSHCSAGGAHFSCAQRELA